MQKHLITIVCTTKQLKQMLALIPVTVRYNYGTEDEFDDIISEAHDALTSE